MKWAAVVAALTATQANALSCIQPDPLATFDRANASDTPYLLLTGQITLDHPAPDPITKPVSLRGTFAGVGLGMTGFNVPFAEAIWLDVTCAGPWCGSVPTDADVMAFVDVGADMPTITLDACGGWVFGAPDQALRDQLTQCLTDTPCSPQPVE
ncbi:hypothetical protein [Loktanella sp. SALINAS62]|uniref:hypothetical protein n=1 Tax=Loktanella sp. SALINAS62 TaxID=2706124 RepID=UPI001B8BCE90|nr:hypothetical protein [Loktanella sp. SALINAS62]MBS1301821.1 hypothetical protein [Loktanella sp. SALINAS62]